MGGGGLAGFGGGVEVSTGEIGLVAGRGGAVVGGVVSLYAGGGGEEGEPFLSSCCSAAASACFVSATGAGAGVVFVRDRRLLLEARVRERLLDSAETEPERRLGSLCEGDGGEAAGDRLLAAGGGGDETEVGVLLLLVLLDTGDQVSGYEGLEVVCETVLGSAGAWKSAGGGGGSGGVLGDLLLWLLFVEEEDDVRRGVRDDAMLSLALQTSLCFVS